MPAGASGSKHIEKLKPKQSHKNGCVTKHKGDFTPDRCAYRYQGYTAIKGNGAKLGLYHIDFTTEANYKRLPESYRERKLGFKKGAKGSHRFVLNPHDNPTAWWFSTAGNYQVAYLPFNHNYHHILPFEALKQLSYGELDILQEAGYNLNAGINLIILPCLEDFAYAMMLPAHPYNHPKYNKDVKTIINNIRQNVSGKKKNHEIKQENVSNFKSDIETWEDNEFWVIANYGKSEAKKKKPAFVNNAPMAAH